MRRKLLIIVLYLKTILSVAEVLARLEEIALINAKLNEELRKEEQYLNEHYYVPVQPPRKQSGDVDATKSDKESVLSMRSTKSNRSSLKSLMASSDFKDLTQYQDDSIEDWEDVRVISPVPTVMNISFSDSDDDWVKSPVKIVASARSGRSGKSRKGESAKNERVEKQAKGMDSEDEWETAEEKTLPAPRSVGSQRAPNRNERRRRGSSQAKVDESEVKAAVETSKNVGIESDVNSKNEDENEDDSEEWEVSKPATVVSKPSDQWDDDSDEWEESKPAESKPAESKPAESKPIELTMKPPRATSRRRAAKLSAKQPNVQRSKEDSEDEWKDSKPIELTVKPPRKTTKRREVNTSTKPSQIQINKDKENESEDEWEESKPAQSKPTESKPTEPEPIDGVHFFIKKDASLRRTDIPGALFRPVAVPGRRALGLVRRGIPQGQNKRKIAAHGDTV